MVKKVGSALATFFIATAVVLWGFSFIWTNDLLQYDVPIFIFIFMRMTIAGSLMFIVSKITKKLQKIEKKDWKWFFLMSFCEPFIYFIGESYGLKLTNSATLAAVVIATIPIFSLVLGRIIYKENISRLNAIGVLMTLPGVILFVWQSGALHADYFRGILLLILAVFGAVGYATVCKRLTSKYNAFTITTYQFVLSLIFFFIPFVVSCSNQWEPRFLSFEVMKPLLFLAVLCSSLSFFFYTESVKYLGMIKTVTWTSLIPLVSAAVAFFSGDEVFTILQVLGILVVVIGVIFSQRNSLKKM